MKFPTPVNKAVAALKGLMAMVVLFLVVTQRVDSGEMGIPLAIFCVMLAFDALVDYGRA